MAKRKAPSSEEMRQSIERSIGIDISLLPAVRRAPDGEVAVPLIVLYYLAKGAQSYLCTYYSPAVLGFSPPKSTDPDPPNPALVRDALRHVAPIIAANITLDALTK